MNFFGFRFFLKRVLTKWLGKKAIIFFWNFTPKSKKLIQIDKLKNVDREKKIIFIHCARTAGKSILCTYSKNWKKGTSHASLSYIIKNIEDFSFDKYFIFVVVRNPFDRLVSLYNYHRQVQASKEPVDILIRNEINKYNNFEHFIRNIRNFKYKNWPTFSSQYKSTHYKKYTFLPVPKIIDGIKILKYENLENDFEPIRKKYELSKLPHYNQTQENKNWKSYYTVDTAKTVYSLYQKDFDVWYPDIHQNLLKYITEKRKD